MGILYFTFEIVVLLFKDGQNKKISKAVPSIYQETYREVGYTMAQEFIDKGWRVYSISIDNIILKENYASLEVY
jgi:hypothetical protein